MRILNTLPDFTPEAKVILAQAGTVDYRALTPDELNRSIADYDGALVGLGLHFNANVLNNAQRLRLIATATTGLDHIDIECATRQGIEVLSLKGEEAFLRTITSTAELALGLMIDVVRRVSVAFESVKGGQWDRERFRGHSLLGKTLGIVGLGRLGTLMVRYGRALGMTVIAYSPDTAPEVFKNEGVESVDFSALLKQSDVISIHAALTPETTNLFTEAVFRQMKKSSVLINTARGRIVNETDLLAALEAGTIVGYATDVLANETEFTGTTIDSNRLVEYSKTHSNVIITPHIGGMTEESRRATDLFIAQKIVQWSLGSANAR